MSSLFIKKEKRKNSRFAAKYGIIKDKTLHAVNMIFR